MKRLRHVFVIALVVAVVTFGLSWAAMSADPWTGEGDGSVAIKFLTVPLALLGLPFLIGMGLAGMALGNEGKNLAGYVMGGVCQYLFSVVITAAVIRALAGRSARHEAESGTSED